MACNTEAKLEKSLIDDIHRIHDVETMPKMGKLTLLKKKLEALEGVDKKVILDLKKDLDDADDAMMEWMVQFNWQSDTTPIKERIKYYDKEVQKLEEMKAIMYSAIDNAEDQLEQ